MKHKTRTKTLSIMLSLVLMLGLVPGTAFAEGHTHSFTYSASGDTITATCQNDGCNLTENKVTLTIKAPENLYYNDTTASHAATLENLEEFNRITERNYSEDKIVYYKGSSQNTDIQNNKPKMTTYTAKIALNPDALKTSSDFFTAGKFVSVTFTFTAKPVEHTHSFTYTASGAVITATCTSTTGTCSLPNKQATLTLNAPLHTTYGDGKDANATLTGEIPGVTNPTINYRKSDTPLSSAPTDVGTYTAWCQLGSATARVEYTIAKAINPGWTTLPQAKANLVYTGEPLELITAGTASAGSALYTVGTDPNNEPDDTAGGRPYTFSVPEMTNAGTYYVWCKIDGGNNYTSIATQKIEVSIAKADITPSVSIVGWTYGQTANTPMVGDTDNPGNGEVTYTYKVKDADDSTYKSTVPTAADNYTVKAVIAETANYNSGVATKDFTISKAALTVTAKDQNISVGDEVPDLSDPVLDTHYTVAGLVGTDTLTTAPTLAYQKNGNAATPDNTALGTYDIVSSGASAGDNYTISYTNGTLTVEKGKAVAATVTANNRTYDGTEKPLVTVTGEATGGTMQYAIGTATEATGTYGTSVPTGTDVGTYYVWYKAAGDAYHVDSDAACVTATINSRPYVPSGSSTPSTPATETITIPVSGEDETVNVKVEVKDDTATVKETDIDKVLSAEEVGTVTVDVSALKENVNEVVIPNEMLEKVADAVADEENTADGLEVKLPAGSVTFDADALATITEQADGKDLTLHLDDVKVTELTSAQQEGVSDLEIEVVLDAYLTSGGKRISDFNGGSATVKIPYTLKDGQTAQGLVVWYVATDGTRSQVPASYDGKNVVFTVPHFSNYVIAYDAEKAAACPKDDTCPISAFTDADPTAWYHDGVHFVLANGIMNGMGDGKFAPNDNTSRAMIVTILYRLEGKPDVSGKANPFEDVADGQWYTDAVIWAAENNIVSGYGNGKFGPNDNITREQLAAILYRYAQSKGQGFTGAWMFLLDYPDASEISTWADEAMHWCVMNGIINGKDGKLVPKGDATRAESATMLMRYCTLDAE